MQSYGFPLLTDNCIRNRGLLPRKRVTPAEAGIQFLLVFPAEAGISHLG